MILDSSQDDHIIHNTTGEQTENQDQRTEVRAESYPEGPCGQSWSEKRDHCLSGKRKV